MELISKGLLSFKPKPLEVVMRNKHDWNALELQKVKLAQTKGSSDLRNLFTDYQQQSQKYLDTMKTTVDSMKKDVNSLTIQMQSQQTRLTTVEQQQLREDDLYEEPTSEMMSGTPL